MSKVRAQHELFDREIATWQESYQSGGGRIWCGRGCSGCCSLAVNAAFTEALCIAGQLSGDRANMVQRHALRLLEKSREQPDLISYLRMYRSTMGMCPLLDDERACTMYDMRPFSCRSLLSTKESSYCVLDFGTLTRAEKSAFLAGLDMSAVSFPTHYAAVPRDIGQQLESGAARSMATRFGFSLYGNLPFLIWLEQEHHLSRIVPEGYDVTARFLEREGLDVPFLVMLDLPDNDIL